MRDNNIDEGLQRDNMNLLMRVFRDQVAWLSLFALCSSCTTDVTSFTMFHFSSPNARTSVNNKHIYKKKVIIKVIYKHTQTLTFY